MPSGSNGGVLTAAQLLVSVDPFTPSSLSSPFFDFLHGPNPAASSRRCAVQSRRRAAKFKYFWKCLAAQQGIGEPGVEDVARSGGIHRIHQESRAVMELHSVPGQDTIGSESRSSSAAAEAPRDLRQGLQQVRNAEQPFGKVARANHEIDTFK